VQTNESALPWITFIVPRETLRAGFVFSGREARERFRFFRLQYQYNMDLQKNCEMNLTICCIR